MLYTADALSRAPMETPSNTESEVEIETIMELCISQLPAGSHRLQEYAKAQEQDYTLSKVLKYCQTEWPKKSNIDIDVMPYWKERANLTIGGKLLLYGRRIVVPKVLQRETLHKIHYGHQGIVRCRLRAAESVWWPGLPEQIKTMIQQCPECLKEATVSREPLISTQLPARPWKRVASDLFQLDGKNYLLVVDYYSRYPEIIQLTSTTSTSIIQALKVIFASHGIPEEFISDNGPQYISQEFTNFSKEYEMIHKTSSPHYPRGNGLAERTVRTMKQLLKKSKDPYLALLEYRNTPMSWCQMSPAQLLMGRRLRTLLPQTDDSLIPECHDMNEFRKKDREYKKKQKEDYDRRYRTTPLPVLPENANVWISVDKQLKPGQVISQADTPQLYLVETPDNGHYRRNRQQLRRRISENNEDLPTGSSSNRVIMTRTQTGSIIRPPDRLDPSF